MKLRHYIARRLLLLIPTLIGVTILIFLVLQFFDPVERASIYITTPQQFRNIDRVIEKYRLNDPIPLQYVYWMREVLVGNLGWSKSVNMPVSDAILTFLPATAELTLYAAPLTILLGIRLGILSAIHRDKSIDHIFRSMAIVGWSLPSFWLGLILLSLFYGGGGIFPPGRLGVDATVQVNSADFVRYTHFNTVDALLNGQFPIFVDGITHLVLPVLTLTIIQVALVMRLMRSSMLESLSKGYIVAARSKGLSEREVIYRHARKNALMPVITVSGILFSSMLNGVVLTEIVFNYVGIGYWAARAATQLDIPAVLGFALFTGVLFIITNLVVDILYAYVDPRIRLG